MSDKKKTRKIGRDARTGKFVSLEKARAEPDTHTVETIVLPVAAEQDNP